jgi:gamma-glutamyltranspeptidase/glutathione hydrolase
VSGRRSPLWLLFGALLAGPTAASSPPGAELAPAAGCAGAAASRPPAGANGGGARTDTTAAGGGAAANRTAPDAAGPQPGSPQADGAGPGSPRAGGVVARSPAGPAVARHAMVVSEQEHATRAGIEILRAGGNAVDAAVAVGFALAVVYPEAGNLGGGGFMVIRFPDGRVTTFDYRETAPLAATETMYLDGRGEPVPNLSWEGHLAAGVPGSVRGMLDALERYGRLDRRTVLAPAIRLARDGFPMAAGLVEALEDDRDFLCQFESTRKAFFPGRPVRETTTAGGRSRTTCVAADSLALGDLSAPPAGDDRAGVPAGAGRREPLALPGGVTRGLGVRAIGDTLRQPDLASTLEAIAEGGAAAFYEGPIADLIEAEMRRGGGLVTRRDLAAYRSIERGPIHAVYRGHDVWSMPPASSGGVVLAEILNVLEAFDLRALGFHSARGVHVLVEAFRRAYADRNEFLGDPAFVEMPIGTLTSKEYAAELAASIDTTRATPSADVRPGARFAAAESPQTTHYSVVDSAGTAVAVTTTINGGFGAGVVVDGAGFLLNNEMDDFTVKPGVPNAYGLVQGRANAIAPGKRMLSAMTPTIVEREGELFLVVGTPGGSTIITTVAQVISNVIDHGMDLQPAVQAGRVHHQHLPDAVRAEPFTLSEDTIRRLEAMGHDVQVRGSTSGRVNAILVDPETRLRIGVADPRSYAALAEGF